MATEDKTPAELEAERIRKEKRNAADRARRARERAVKVAEGTYRRPRSQPSPEQQRMAEESEQALAGKLNLPAHVVASLDKRQLYLAYLEKGLRRSQAADQAGVTYSTVKYWRRSDDKFRAQEADVEETILDKVEDTLVRLALEGDLRAAEKVLQAKRSAIWAPKSKVEHEHTLQFSGSLEDRMARIAQLMQQVRPEAIGPGYIDAYVVEDSALAEPLSEGPES